MEAYEPTMSGTTFSIFSTLLFISLSRILNVFEPLIGNFLKSKKAGAWWTFKNILVSFAHSTISAWLSIWCIYQEPDVLFNPIVNGPLLNFYVICFSQGYFLYDLIDVFVNRNYYKYTAEIFTHHLFILINIALALYSRNFFGFVILGLVTENHNILLHFRSLLKQVGITPQRSRLYKLVAYGNLIALTVFRLLPYAYVKYYCFRIYMTDQVPQQMRFCFFSYWLSTALLFVYSFYLLRRCLRTDFPMLSLRHELTRKYRQQQQAALHAAAHADTMQLTQKSKTNLISTSENSINQTDTMLGAVKTNGHAKQE